MSERDQYLAAEIGRIGADRMALGLGSIADPRRGDMDEVARLRERVAELEEDREHHLRMLDESCAAVNRLGFRSDECGGPTLPECIIKLGQDRDDARARIRDLEADKDALDKELARWQWSVEEGLKHRREAESARDAAQAEVERLREALDRCERTMTNEMDDRQEHWLGRAPGSFYREALVDARAALADESPEAGS